MNKILITIGEVDAENLHLSEELIFFEIGKRFYERGYIVDWLFYKGNAPRFYKGINFIKSKSLLFHYLKCLKYCLFDNKNLLVLQDFNSKVLPLPEQNSITLIQNYLRSEWLNVLRPFPAFIKIFKEWFFIKLNIFNNVFGSFSQKLLDQISNQHTKTVTLKPNYNKTIENEIKRNFQFVSINSIERINRIEDQINALSKVKTLYPEAKLMILGKNKDETYFNDLTKLIKDLDLGSCVKFIQHVDYINMEKIISRSIATLNTSYSQDRIFELIRGISLSTPFISYNHTQTPFLKHNKMGLFTYDNQTVALTNLMLFTIADSKSYLNLVQNCEKYGASLSWDQIFNEIIYFIGHKETLNLKLSKLQGF